MKRSVFGLLFLIAPWIACADSPAFTIRDHLEHRWTDELVHFPIDAKTKGTNVTLVGSDGKPVPTQLSDVRWNARTKRLQANAWTVVSLEPGGSASFTLREGRPPADSDLVLRREKNSLLLANAHVALRLPQYRKGGELRSLPAPVEAVRAARDSTWLGAGSWFHDGESLTVEKAATTVIEQGPVRVVVRHELTFAGGRTYSARIELGSRQEVAKIIEECDRESARAGWRFSFQPGLNADHVFWNNQWSQEVSRRWAMMDTAVAFDQTNVVATLRPWSFWWMEGGTMWAGFYQRGADPFVGVLMLNPSRWLPGQSGFEHTAIPINAGPEGRLDMTLSFLTPAGKKAGDLLRREWGITVGTTAEHVLDPKTAMPLVGKPGGTPKLRYQLVKHGEFPLDEVKDYGFEFQSRNAGRQHPFLILSPADVARARRQAKTVPAAKAQVEQSLTYIAGCGTPDRTLTNEGPQVFYTRHYWGNGLTEVLPEAYLGSDDPIYGKMLAAAVQGLSRDIYTSFIEHPNRPGIGAYGPWVTADFTRLLFAYDLIAGSGLLSPEDEQRAHRALVFGAQFLSHPDYWNVEHGLASGNPNMSNMIRLTLGLLGLYLDGHPRAETWAAGAEAELKEELADWISPGGAFIECPGYQGASLDGMLLLARAIRNVHGRDYFADPNFKATMDYYGTLLTPPDRRFPPPGLEAKFNPTQFVPGAPPTSMLPPIGDTPLGSISAFPGLMAAGAAASDPAFSRQQMFFWKLQNFSFAGGNRAGGYTVAMCDAELPASPPTVLARRFPGFGNILRTSWTDPRASYVSHRTGPSSHHYHDDYNSIIYYAKGAPLALDFGNQYAPLRRDEAWWHNRVSFSTADSPTKWGSTGEPVELRSLPATIDYSLGKSRGSGNQEAHRHLLLVKSADPMGANYVVIRDRTLDGQPGQQFSWNLFCLSRPPRIDGATVHFPGQFDVDLDVHVLSPARPQITTDHWQWEKQTGAWRMLREEQHGVRVAKSGSGEDYLTVLYPRATGQAAAGVTTLANGSAMQVNHMEGTDVVLLSPDKAVSAVVGDVKLNGEIAFARRYSNGDLRLAVVKGTDASAACGAWGLAGSEPVSLEIKNGIVTGEWSGEVSEIRIVLPPGHPPVDVLLDGKPHAAKRTADALTIALPSGTHRFEIRAK